jgi:hypothetical protein
MSKLPQKRIGRNEPPKRRNRYTIVGLNRILDTLRRELNQELRSDISNGITPAWDIASIQYQRIRGT